MITTLLLVMVAHKCAPWSAALYVTVQSRKSAITCAETGSLLVTRPVTTATRLVTMAAAAAAPRRRDGPVSTRPADRQAAMKCAAMTSKLQARDVMTATLSPETGARTSAPWSAGTFVMHQHHNPAIQYVEMGSLLATKAAMITTPSAGMVAAASVPRSLDGTAPPPRNADEPAVLQSVETARKLEPRFVMMETMTLTGTVVRTRARWTAGTRAATMTV
jgi:hypothetical protein